MGLLEKSVGLVGVAQVSRRHYHVSDMLRQISENRGRRVAGGHVGFQWHFVPVNGGKPAAEVALEQGCLFGIFLPPLLFFGMADSDNLFQFTAAFAIERLGLGEYLPWIGGVAPQIAYCGIHVSASLA